MQTLTSSQSRACQKADWKVHKISCVVLQQHITETRSQNSDLPNAFKLITGNLLVACALFARVLDLATNRQAHRANSVKILILRQPQGLQIVDARPCDFLLDSSVDHLRWPTTFAGWKSIDDHETDAGRFGAGMVQVTIIEADSIDWAAIHIPISNEVIQALNIDNVEVPTLMYALQTCQKIGDVFPSHPFYQFSDLDRFGRKICKPNLSQFMHRPQY